MTNLWLLLALLFFSCGYGTQEKKSYSSVEDLAGGSVAVCVGSTHDIFLSKYYPEIELFRVNEVSYGLLPVVTGQVDAVAMGAVLAKNVIREDDRFTVLDKPLFYENMGIGFANETLRDKFNTMLSRMRESGELAEYVDKWVEDDGTAVLDDYTFTGENGELYVGINLTIAYGFFRDEKPCGIDLELIYKFCEEYGYIPSTENLCLGALIAALNSNSLDMICGGLAVTAERKNMILFSEPHIQSSVKLVVLRKNKKNEVFEEETTQTLVRRLKNTLYYNLIAEKRYKKIFYGLMTTLCISIWSIVLGTVLGWIICLMRICHNKILKCMASAYVNILYGVPQLVILMIMYYIVFVSTDMSGLRISIATFAIFLSGVTSELSRAAILGMDKGQLDASRSMGFNQFQVFLFFMVPQVIGKTFHNYTGAVVSLVKMTSIVGYIAVCDLTEACEEIKSRTFEAAFVLAFVSVIYFLLSWLIVKLMKMLRAGYDKKGWCFISCNSIKFFNRKYL